MGLFPKPLHPNHGETDLSVRLITIIVSCIASAFLLSIELLSVVTDVPDVMFKPEMYVTQSHQAITTAATVGAAYGLIVKIFSNGLQKNRMLKSEYNEKHLPYAALLFTCRSV